MTTIGILGAGQLGRMLALAGYPLGMRFRFLDPAPDSPAGLLAEHWACNYADTAALERFARGVDVVTYEFENVPVEAARFLERFVPVYPPPIALEKSQDRWIEKNFFGQWGIPTPRYTTDLENGLTGEIGFPAVLKTRRMGYDGKGQVLVESNSDLNVALEHGNRDEFILEEFIPFDRELSIIGVRSKGGEMKFYPLVENVHREGILRVSLVTGQVPADLQRQAEDDCKAVMSALEYVGVLAVEFFEKDGRLSANEMAPRVHNSGHWTIEGAATSQFENHLRAISESPLGSTDLRGACAMINLIGELPDVKSLLRIDGVHMHLYDKPPRPKRKIGHVTLVEKDMENLTRKLELVREIIDVP